MKYSINMYYYIAYSEQDNVQKKKTWKPNKIIHASVIHLYMEIDRALDCSLQTCVNSVCGKCRCSEVAMCIDILTIWYYDFNMQWMETHLWRDELMKYLFENSITDLRMRFLSLLNDISLACNAVLIILHCILV